MFVGERYTLTPIALAGNENDGWHVVNGAGMSWSSLDDGIAKVSSFGQVLAWGVGTTTVQVQSGGASKQIPVEVRSGTRPTGSNQDADLDIGDCSGEQASMFAPKSAAAPKAQLSLIGNDGVMYDWDPDPMAGSRAAYFRNAVGSPRFAAKSRAASAVPTSTQLGSDNYQFNVPVTSVGGRGVSAAIGMTFNSRVWNTDDGKMTFNYVGGYPGPGWSMGYGKIIRNYNNTGAGDKSGVGNGNSPGDYLLVTGEGTRIPLTPRYDTTSGHWFHESTDGSFLRFDPIGGEMRYPDGSRMIYSVVNGCLLPTAIIGTNGGVITMSYRDYCEGNCTQVFRHRTALNAVRDTLGRYVTFHYYGDPVDANGDGAPDYPVNAAGPSGELAAIKAPNEDGVQQEIIHVKYRSITLKYNFGGLLVDAPANNSPVQVMERIYYPQTGRGFLFQDYSSYGMPRKISSRIGMKGAGGAITEGTEIAYTTYNYTTIDPINPNDPPYDRNQVGSLTDFPQFTRREEWRLGQTDPDGNPTTVTTKYEYPAPTTNASTEVVTIKHVGRDYEEATTIGTDSSQLNFGKVISVESKRTSSQATLSKQVFTYMLGLDGETEIRSIETTDDVEQKRLVRFEYGHYGRVNNQYECGYTQDGNCQTRRRTQYEYMDADYVNARFLRLVSGVSIYDENGGLKAKTITTYDDYNAMGGILNYASPYAPNHDDTYDDTKVIRGNPTGVTTFSDISAGESTTRHVRYDIFGNVVEAQLSCCVKKIFRFSSLTRFSQPDQVQSGEGDLSLQTNYEYNDFTGLITEMQSEGQRTEYEYDNALRLTHVRAPTGAEVETTLQDDNGNNLLTYVSRTSYTDQGTTKVITGKQWFDGSGRVIRAGTGTGADPGSYDMTAAVYDGWGRVTKRSNPYLGDAAGNGDAQFWTINSYDELSRVTDVTLPGAPPAQTIHTNYDGAITTVTDTVGRRRRSEVDGLGRLVKVIEQNPANGNLEWETNYSYDALNNLIQTNQGGQTRTFEYDAKGRLKRETTPEAGTINYTYTNFDAVATRRDARGVVTRYTYGELNLLTNMQYDTASAPGVIAPADVNIRYKDASPGKAQIDEVKYGDGTTWSESYGYDQYGRLLSRLRMIDGISYPSQYEYNAAGQMTTMTYPSGKRVKMGHDDRGRLADLRKVDDSGNPQGTSYLSGINYRVDGLISGQSLGDGTSEEFGYSNDRLQLTSQKVMKGGSPLLDLTYGYEATAGKMVLDKLYPKQVMVITTTTNGKIIYWILSTALLDYVRAHANKDT